jgi:hypothetical protein
VYLCDSKVVGPDPIESVISEHLIDPIVLQPFTAELYDQFFLDRTKNLLQAIGTAVSADPIAEQAERA